MSFTAELKAIFSQFCCCEHVEIKKAKHLINPNECDETLLVLSTKDGSSLERSDSLCEASTNLNRLNEYY
jgi:hypothetical protein